MISDPRQKTWELAKVDVDAALRFTEKIESDWNRVQALAMVAWHTKPKARFERIVKEALAIARKMPEPNRAVSSSSWVVSAMAERDDINILSVVQELLEIIAREPNPVRQSDALLLLFEAVYRKREIRQMVLDPLLRACTAMKSWKRPRTLSYTALILAGDDLIRAREVIDLISDDPYKRKTNEAITKQQWLGPHKFVPYYTKVVTNSEAQLVR